MTIAGYVLGLIVGVGLILTYGAMEVSSTPAFCGTCHVMAPYFESWETSSHASIACVDCHIPPGITAELRKKFEALSMVARYFTATYGTNPWTEVDDAACLECHERRLLVGKEVFGEILFDHGPHLSELRRGKKLRCTSCHSQIVQGSHITVTATTCTLCHFKGQPAGEGTAQCTLCHVVPDRVVEAGGLDFNHGDVSRFGMECQSCHTPPRPEAGRVPRERCLTCHNDAERLNEYKNGDFLHRAHVTDHKVECTHCHLEIEHVAPRHLDAAQSECEACHGGKGGGHSPQRDLYAGIGGQGVPPMPDVMYQAGVRCEGCHIDHSERGTRTAGEVSCMSCHGPAYRSLFQSWKSALQTRSAGLRRQLDSSARRLGSTESTEFVNAQANLELVEKGRGIHNVPFSMTLLETAHRQLNAAREELGLRVLGAPWPQPSFDSPCLDCHIGAESQTVKVFGKTFSHGKHVMGNGINCENCHSTHEERDAGVSPLKIEASDCSSCHHRKSSTPCVECHQQLGERTFSVELGSFEHSIHVEMMEIPCQQCHGEGQALRRQPKPEVCSDCH
jgi:nitrate/TMAO reductase-like tetraheme cytochrome c subunit